MQTSSRMSAAIRVGRRAFFGNSLPQAKFGLCRSLTSSCEMGMATSTSRTLPIVNTSRFMLCNRSNNLQGTFGSRAVGPVQPSHMTLMQTSRQPFGSSRRCLCEKTSKDVANTQSQKLASADEQITKVASSEHHQHFSARNATNFDKKLLVFFGKYKTVEEVPSLVSIHLISSTRNKFRVYVNIVIGAITALSCIVMIYRGHSRSGHGETLAHHNMMRHPEHYQKQLKG